MKVPPDRAANIPHHDRSSTWPKSTSAYSKVIISTAWPDLHDEVGVGESLTLVADSVVDQTKAEVESHREHDGSPVDDCPRLRLNSQLGRDNFDTDTDCPCSLRCHQSRDEQSHFTKPKHVRPNLKKDQSHLYEHDKDTLRAHHRSKLPETDRTATERSCSQRR